MKLTTLVIIAAAFATSSVSAQDAPTDKEFDAGFVAVDTNKDGKLDKQEAKIDATLLTSFDLLDTDKDGFISKAEMNVARTEAAKVRK